MNKYQIAVVNGDGIGNEIVPVAFEVLGATAKKHNFSITSESFDYGAKYYLEHGDFMEANGLDKLKKFDAILFGAVGLPEVDDRLPFKMFTNKVRTAFNQYVNYRPVKLLEGIDSPLRNKSQKDIDFIIIRENNEGEFVQNGRWMYPDESYGFATDTNLFTRAGIERIAHFSFKLAQKRNKNLINVTKSNTLIYTLGYWDKIIESISLQYPDVHYRKMYIDAASANFVLRPEIFDVVLTTNMLGDILSDLGGAIMGSLGYGGSGNINPEKKFPSMFEPIHGSAPDIAGKGIANPIGQINSVSILLDHIGEHAASQDLFKAINKVTTKGILTPDVGGKYSTKDVANAVIDNL